MYSPLRVRGRYTPNLRPTTTRSSGTPEGPRFENTQHEPCPLTGADHVPVPRRSRLGLLLLAMRTTDRAYYPGPGVHDARS